MNLNEVHRIYFLGIGGIGMSALARWFKSRGLVVSGYDRTRTPLTDQLSAEGIAIHYEDNPGLIDQAVLGGKQDSLIVYTPAIPSDHLEFNELKSRGFEMYKRSEVLGMITRDHFTIAVAGTHGKTSTSSIIAHILHTSGKNCAAFVGGIMVNYQSNLILPADVNPVVVVEADEFDRSFLKLNPNLAVVTAADPDHLDIYGDADSLRQSFRDFISRINDKGRLFVKERAARELEITELTLPQKSLYSLEHSPIHAENIRVDDGAFVFDYVSPEERINDIRLYFPGRHNIENALAAISVALYLQVSGEAIKNSISFYRGVKRRFEYILKTGAIAYIDDYAHHPEEIRSFILALRELYPDKKITVIFQPHLFSRTRDFADGFAESLALADEIILIPIYPARELPIEGVNSEMILEKMPGSRKKLVAKNKILEVIGGEDLEVLATIGAGDIDQLVAPIKKLLEEKYD